MHAQVSLPFVAFLVCFFAFAMRLTAEANKEVNAGRPYKIKLWRVAYQFICSHAFGFLAWLKLLETDWGNGLKVGLLFGVSFVATVIADALLLIKPAMLLRALLSYAQKQIGTGEEPPQYPPYEPPANLPQLPLNPPDGSDTMPEDGGGMPHQ